MTCRAARSTIVELVRDQASEADRLRLDQHLGGCEPCREERARWSLMERLRDQPTRRLGAQARARVLHTLIADAQHAGELPQRAALPPLARRHRVSWALGIAAVAAVALLAVARLSGDHPDRAAPLVIAAGQLVHQAEPGALRIDGAQLWYRGGSSIRLAGARRIDLLDGEVEVEVKPGGPGRFRVYAPRFIVEVIGTRFVVHQGGMRTVHGTVRVLDLEGRELAVVRAGEEWRAPVATQQGAVAAQHDAVAAQQSTVAKQHDAVATQQSNIAAQHEAGTQYSSAPVPVVKGDAEPARQPAFSPRHVAAARSEETTPAARLLEEADHDLAAARLPAARDRIAAALAAHPSLRERARADLLSAESLLGAGSHADTAAAYRRVAERWAGYPEGEQAAFACAEILSEYGTADAARAALTAYLTRYPTGRFQHDAESKLSQLRSATAQ